ncbi:MAG: hypothetical protein ACFFG0_15290 [Candidatus Thorarchaeota archaeon]
MKIIAIGHQKGVGKSTLAKFLVTELRVRNKGFKIGKLSFADEVKNISHQLFSWTGLKSGQYYENHYDEKETPLNFDFTPRDIWIAVGNKMREIHPNVWIEAAFHNCDYDIVIIPDLRFKNEAIWLENHGACLVKIHRDMPRGADPAEIDLLDWKNWCMEINNKRSLQDLYKEAQKIADYLEN